MNHKTTAILLACSLVLAVLFAVLAGVFHGFIQSATSAAPQIDSKKAKKWVSICMWLAIAFALLTLGAGYALSRQKHADALVNAQSASTPTESAAGK